MDAKHVIAIVDTLKFFITTQSTRLETAFAVDYQQAVRARAAYTSLNGPRSFKDNKLANSFVDIDNNVHTKKNDIYSKIGTSNNNTNNAAAKRPRESEQRAPSNVPIIPPKPLSADVILKNILEVFKEAYRWLKDMDKGDIFASKVCPLHVIKLFHVCCII